MNTFFFASLARHGAIFFSLLIPASVVVACSGGTDTSSSSSSSGSTGTGSGTGTGTGTGTGSGNGSGSSTVTSPSTPTGKSCGNANDCAYWFCDCKDGAVVNSRSCTNGTCQDAKVHCPSACNGFNHGGWTGTAGGGDKASSSSPGGPTPSGSCKSKDECSPFSCGCTDGSRISVRECFNGTCSNASSGCQSACSDDGRGDWDGT